MKSPDTSPADSAERPRRHHRDPADAQRRPEEPGASAGGGRSGLRGEGARGQRGRRGPRRRASAWARSTAASPRRRPSSRRWSPRSSRRPSPWPGRRRRGPTAPGSSTSCRQSSAYQAEHLGCLPKLWNTDHHLVQTARELIAGLLADAQAHGRVRPDLTSTDISLVMWSIRGVLETTGPQRTRGVEAAPRSPDRRHAPERTPSWRTGPSARTRSTGSSRGTSASPARSTRVGR